ncbi:type II toxin-antitoxin system tRNA(fMet)-specific endonuclease VapC [Terracidiphilus gabretensis]|uniref:type II toxin-antitoxin system tRNA(fMet)-specific endonuclease VapC n=1 Tax=Terracidiphilus gabretensis TaxID=1577687 RepID=UPI001E3707C9|nr:PIN domain-containing protein [Terracidiphilus gabretensis]
MLDTDIVSYAMKKTSPKVLHRLAQTALTDICLSSIVLAELEFGVAASVAPIPYRSRLDDFLRYVNVLDFPVEAARDYGTIRADLKIRGQIIGSNDLLIAAHARYLGLTLVTNNIREYTRIPGLKLENWAE